MKALLIIYGIIVGASAAVTYTRWGRTTCPTGSFLVYSGRVGGSWYDYSGGAAEYLCLPNEDTSYLDYVPGYNGNQGRQARLFGTEYETGVYVDSLGPLGDKHHQYNVPCAVCTTYKKSMQLMIPARAKCPNKWRIEYAGYLMTNYDGFYRTKFICVDKDAENIPGTSNNADGALLYHVRVDSCGDETFPCSGYDPAKELACAFCTR